MTPEQQKIIEQAAKEHATMLGMPPSNTTTTKKEFKDEKN